MFQLFLKSKKAIILSATVAVLSVVVLVGGIVVGQKKKTRFPANGYVMQVETSEDSQAVANQVRFASGTALNKKASSMITFKSEEGQTVESKSDAFIHYEDGSLASADKIDFIHIIFCCTECYGHPVSAMRFKGALIIFALITEQCLPVQCLLCHFHS